MVEGGAAYEALGALYDAWCAEVVEDEELYRQLAAATAAEAGRTIDVVELGAGSGRVAVALAADGHRVRALEASPAQLERLRERARIAGLDVAAVEGDLLDAPALLGAGSADLVIAPFRVLLHVAREPTRGRALAGARELLRPGGVLAFDVFHPTGEEAAAAHGELQERRTHATPGGAWTFTERAWFTAIDGGGDAGGHEIALDVACTWAPSRRVRGPGAALPAPVLDDPPPGQRELEVRLELHAPPPHAWREAIERAGLELDAAYGWFDARPLDPGCDDSIWVARRPA